MGKTSHSEQQEMFPPPPLLPFQGGKPQPSPLARRTDPASSHAAAEHVESTGKAKADCERLLEVLRLRPIFNYELPNIAGLNGTARVSDLRKLGYTIECRRVKRDGKTTGTTMYVLTGGPGVDA